MTFIIDYEYFWNLLFSASFEYHFYCKEGLHL